MSYILDALERSEHERKQGELPSFRQEQGLLYMRKERRSPWLAMLVVVLLLNAMVFLYIHFAGTDESQVLPFTDAQTNSQDKEEMNVSAPSAESVRITKATEVEGSKSPEQSNSLLVDSSASSLQSETQSGLLQKNPSGSPESLIVPKLVGTEAPVLRDQTISVGQASSDSPIVETDSTPAVAAMETGSTFNQAEPQFELIEPKSKRQQRLDQDSDFNVAALDSSWESTKPMQASFESEVVIERNDGDVAVNTDPYSDVRYLDELDQGTRPRVSQLTFNSHIYSSTPSARRVMINNIYLREGQEFQGMTLLSIAEQYVVFEKDGQKFKIAAMRDWLG